MILNVLVRAMCLGGPLCFFVLVAGTGGRTIEAWRVNTAGLIVLAWSCTVAAWRLAVRKRLRLPGRIEMRRRYRRAFVASFIQQAFILFLASLLLDGGLTFYACLVADMSYWMLAGIVVARRPIRPTPFDLSLIGCSYPALALLVTVAVWQWQEVLQSHPYWP